MFNILVADDKSQVFIVLEYPVPTVSCGRNRSHCTVYKQTNSNIDQNMGNRKRNKTQSKKCGCTFTFTILYDYNHELWYKKEEELHYQILIQK